MNDGMGDKLASPSNSDRPHIKEGFYYHEKAHNGRLDSFTKPFRRMEVERLLVLRESDPNEMPNRPERVPILETYEKENDWLSERQRQPRAHGKPWCKDRFLIEDIYFIYKYDVDRLHERKSNSLYFQLILFIKGGSQSGGIRKLDLWFKNDDMQKREDWISEIYKLRQQLQLDSGSHDPLVNHIPTTFFNLRNPTEPIPKNKPKSETSELFPEVQYSYLEVNFGNLDPSVKDSTIREMRRIAEAEIKKEVKLLEKEVYHLKYKITQGTHEKFQALGSSATKYFIEFISPRDSQVVYAIGNNEFGKIGKFPSVNPKDPESRVVAIEILAKPSSATEIKLRKLPGYSSHSKAHPHSAPTHYTSQLFLKFTRETDKKAFLDKYLALKDQNMNASQNLGKTNQRRWTGPPKPNKSAQQAVVDKEDSGGTRKRTESAGPEKVNRTVDIEMTPVNVAGQRSDPSSLPAPVTENPMETNAAENSCSTCIGTCVCYGNLHLQRGVGSSRLPRQTTPQSPRAKVITTSLQPIASTRMDESGDYSNASNIRQSKMARRTPTSSPILTGQLTEKLVQAHQDQDVKSKADSKSNVIRNG